MNPKMSDFESKSAKFDSNLVSQPGAAQTQTSVGNLSTIEQQLDLKYKAYSRMNSGPNPSKMTGTMLPNNSQFLYAAASNLRSSLDKGKRLLGRSNSVSARISRFRRHAGHFRNANESLIAKPAPVYIFKHECISWLLTKSELGTDPDFLPRRAVSGLHNLKWHQRAAFWDRNLAKFQCQQPFAAAGARLAARLAVQPGKLR